MRKLFEAIFHGKQKLQQEWNCLEAWTADVRFITSGYIHPWGCEGTEIGSTTNEIGSGDTNTDAILAGCTATNNAATIARVGRGGETDWYLPNGVEAQAMNTQKAIIPDFDPSIKTYWTSYEDTADRAFFLIGSSLSAGLKSAVTYVRPIRKCLGSYSVGDIGPSGGVIFYIKPAVPTHKISIYDVDLVENNSSQDVILEAPGYTVNWNANVSDVVSGGIIESSADFTIRNIQGVLDDFIDDLNVAREGKYVVDIQKKTVLDEEWQSFWKGIIMPDFSSRTDIPNEPISFQATDGIGLLAAKEITSEDDELILVTAIKGLRQIPTLGLFDVLSELRFLWCKTDWYSENLSTGTEPLYQIGLFGKSLWVKKEVSEGYSGALKTEIVGLTYKEVLQHICERFNCVLVMQQGAWYLYQRDLLLEDTIVFSTFRAYPTSGSNWTTNPPTSTVDTYKVIDQSARHRSSGEFFNLPGVKSVTAIYGGGTLADGNDSLIPSGFEPGQTYTTMPLEATTDNKLHLRISFLENFLIEWVGTTPPDVYFSAVVKYKIIIRCGAYYLNAFTGAWTLNSAVADFTYTAQTKLYHITAEGVTENNVPPFVDQVSFYKDMITEDIPTDSEITFRMERSSILVENGAGSFTVDINDDFGFTPDLENHFLLYIVNDEGPQSYVEFTASNPTAGFQLEHNMGESLFGTARVIMNRVIGSYNGGGELWEVGTETPALYFNELLVRELVRKQNKALMCFSGLILERDEDFMQLFQAIQFDVAGVTFRYVFNNVTYNAMRETWDGDWIELHNTSTVIVPISVEEVYDINDIPAIPRPSGPIFDQAVEGIYNPATRNLDTTQEGNSEGGVITNFTETERQGTPEVAGENRIKTYPDTNGVLKQLDSYGVEKTIGADASPVEVNPRSVTVVGGFLYNWWVTQEVTLVSDTDWKVPTNAEFQVLVNYLIARGFNYDSTTTGNKIGKALATDSGWDASTVVGAIGNTDYPTKRNATGFSLYPSGARNAEGGGFSGKGLLDYIWTGADSGTDSAKVMLGVYYATGITDTTKDKNWGLNIRLMRVATAPEQTLADGTVIEDAYTGNNGLVYQGVKLGTQIWLSDPLAETELSTGIPIPLCEDADVWKDLSEAAYCAYDNNMEEAYSGGDEVQFKDDKYLAADTIQYNNDNSGLAAEEVQAAIDALTGMSNSYKRGFDRLEVNTMGEPTYTAGTRTFALAVKSGQTLFQFWSGGVLYKKTTTQSIVWPNVTGTYYFYFDTTGTLQYVLNASMTEAIFLRCALCGLVYWNATESSIIIQAIDEQHGIIMDGSTHLRLHSIEGFTWSKGSDLIGLADAADDYTEIEGGSAFDEDIYLSTLATATHPFLYRKGADGGWVETAADNKAGHIVSGDSNVSYNQEVGGVWELTESTNTTDYIIYMIIKTNDSVNPYKKVVGQQVYASRNLARKGLKGELKAIDLQGFPSSEATYYYAYIVKKNGDVEDDGEGHAFVDLRGMPLITLTDS